MVLFPLGNFRDEIDCDVVNMDAFQILLERLWQFDVEAMHKGRLNVMCSHGKVKKIALLPTKDYAPFGDQTVNKQKNTLKIFY